MKKEELSLMIVPFGYDLLQGKMTLEDIFALTARKGLSRVDVLGINRALLAPCREAMEPLEPFNPLAEHTKDGQFMRGVVWGDGVIPVAEVAARLRRDGYTGPLAMEYAHPGVFTQEAHEEQLDRFFSYFSI